MDAFFAALIGAIVGGLVTIFGSFKLDTHQRNKRRDNLRVAIAAEVASLGELARRQRYSHHLREFADYIERLPEGAYPRFFVPAEHSYFTVFEGNSSAIGDLPSTEAVEIIAFYQQAKSILDTVRNDGSPDPTVIPNAEAAAGYRQVAILIDNLCGFADELVAKLTTGKIVDHINAAALRLTSVPKVVGSAEEK